MGLIAKCDNSLIDTGVYTYETYNYDKFDCLRILPHGKGGSKAQRHIDYIDAICTLDIETTKIEEIKQSICYIWQICINGSIIIGRELPELKKFLDRLQMHLDSRTRILFYIHNLSFEFHHLREILDFTNVFSIDKRRPLKAMYKNIEFRCSYILSNLSLRAYLEKMGVPTKKTDLDYNKTRYPWTKINAKDFEYCVNDVLGLYQAIKKNLSIENDTLYTIPLTSTGYTRRDVKNALKRYCHTKHFVESIPTFDIFLLLNDAFRGGNTHANRWISGKLIDSEIFGVIKSKDRASSYPDVILKHKYPFKFEPCIIGVKKALELGKAILTKVTFTDIKLKNNLDGCPYIPISKCKNVKDPVEDNGRILSASTLTMTLTDIDLKIINQTYTYSNAIFTETYMSDYEELPQQLKKVVLKYFKGKTELKGIEEKENDYIKFKGRFNAIYGLMVQSPAKLLIEYNSEYPDLFANETGRTLEEVYNKNIKNTTLLYQWGVWVTAWARWELQRAINLVQSTPGAIFLYTDTDSVKYIGDVDFSAYNNEHIKRSIEVGAVAKDVKGNVHYIGVFESESDMLKFITHGAKKYAYTCIEKDKKSGEEKEGLHLTCAGVNKKAGAEELGSIKWFKEGFIFGNAAGVEAVYNDRPEVRSYIVNGKKLHIYSNIYLKDSTYTLGKAPKYKMLLDRLSHLSL